MFMQDISIIRRDIDVNRIFTEIDNFILSLDDFVDQICIQGTHAEMDPYVGSRSLIDLMPMSPFYDNKIDQVGATNSVDNTRYRELEAKFNVFLFPELDYTNSVIEELGMVRTRVMHMQPKTCLSYHQDPTKRIHIPIDTNENCFLLIENVAYHIPDDGSVYLVDTTKHHTAVNASRDTRTHIMGTTWMT